MLIFAPLFLSSESTARRDHQRAAGALPVAGGASSLPTIQLAADNGMTSNGHGEPAAAAPAGGGGAITVRRRAGPEGAAPLGEKQAD